MRRDLMEKNKQKLKKNSNKLKKIVEVTKKERDLGEELYEKIENLEIDKIKNLVYEQYAYLNVFDKKNEYHLIHKSIFILIFSFKKKKK
jgi:hypothetical protein